MGFFLLLLFNLLFSFNLEAQTIQRAGTGCPDHFCVWAIGNSFGENPVVYIYEDPEAKYLISRYSKKEMSVGNDPETQTESVSLKLATPFEMDAFEKRALYLRILNTNSYTFSNIFELIRDQPTSPVVSPGPVLPLKVGGTNYVVYDLGKYLEDPNSWGHPVDGVKMVFARYDENKNTVKNHIAAIAQSGQKRISTVLWYVNYPQAPNNVHMHAINVSAGISQRHQQNMREVFNEIKKYPFETFVLRFGPQGNETPSSWKKWEEENYLVQWNAIKQAIDITEEIFSNSHIKTLYDLSAENGGLDNEFSRHFTSRLWKDYVERYGLKKSYGTSMAYYPGRLKNLVEDFDRSGKSRPSSYAVDIYSTKSIDGEFYRLAKELKEIGESKKEIVLQETFYNNGNVKLAVDYARTYYGLNITSINQWNLEQDNPGTHFSILDPTKYSAYTDKYYQPSLSSNLTCTWQKYCIRMMGSQITQNAKFLIMDGMGTQTLLETIMPGDYNFQQVGKGVYVDFPVSLATWDHYMQYGLTIVAKEKYDLETPAVIIKKDGSFVRLAR